MKNLLLCTVSIFCLLAGSASATGNEDKSGVTVKTVSSYTITSGGSAGTPGTFAIGGLGTGTCTTAPVGTFTVTGSAGAGVVASLNFTTQGICTVAPTPTFTASGGLTSTNITLNLDNLYTVPQNSQRRGFYVLNPNASDACWIRFTNDIINAPAAANGVGSFKVAALTGLMMSNYPPKEAMSVECATVGDGITAWEVQSQ